MIFCEETTTKEMSGRYNPFTTLSTDQVVNIRLMPAASPKPNHQKIL